MNAKLCAKTYMKGIMATSNSAKMDVTKWKRFFLSPWMWPEYSRGSKVIIQKDKKYWKNKRLTICVFPGFLAFKRNIFSCWALQISSKTMKNKLQKIFMFFMWYLRKMIGDMSQVILTRISSIFTPFCNLKFYFNNISIFA